MTQRGSPAAWLAGTSLGVYALVVVGAVTGLSPAAAACGGWPTCDGYWVVPFTDLPRIIAWTHRALTTAVGALLAWTAVRVWHRGSRRVRWSTLAALAAFPLQVVVGAAAARTTATPAVVNTVHLVLGMALFSALLAALAWHLEDETAAGQRTDATTTGYSPAANPGSEPPDPPNPGRLAVARAYLELTKPKLMWLLCLVALAAMALVAGPSLDPATVAATLTGGVLAVGASGTFNNVLERDADREMARTADRPLPTDRVPVRNAVAFGFALAAASTGVFLAFVNALAAALGVLAILFYSVVYTVVLKPRTDQNVVIGGAVGAFPALIGWAAVTGTVGLPAVALGTVVFLWTPAHFYNLALAYREDYARGGFPMLPVVRGEATTRKHVLGYLGATLAAAAALGAHPALGWLYAAATVAAGSVFLAAAVHLHRAQTDAAAFRTFHAANAYLGVLLVAVVVDGGFV